MLWNDLMNLSNILEYIVHDFGYVDGNDMFSGVNLLLSGTR
jgi:hypothetical protein